MRKGWDRGSSGELGITQGRLKERGKPASQDEGREGPVEEWPRKRNAKMKKEGRREARMMTEGGGRRRGKNRGRNPRKKYEVTKINSKKIKNQKKKEIYIYKAHDSHCQIRG